MFLHFASLIIAPLDKIFVAQHFAFLFANKRLVLLSGVVFLLSHKCDTWSTLRIFYYTGVLRQDVVSPKILYFEIFVNDRVYNIFCLKPKHRLFGHPTYFFFN